MASAKLEIPNLSREFLHACQSGNMERLRTLTSRYQIEDWTVFRHSASGDTALHVAAREGHLHVVQYLCESFEKPESKTDVVNKDMKRPLHEAAQFAHSSVLKYLIQRGASVDSLKRADWTSLMLACTKTGSGAIECVSALLDAGSDPRVRNKDGWTCFLVACRTGDQEIVDLLANRHPVCIEDRSNNGRSAMHIAAFHGHRRIIDLLAAANPGLLNARDSSGSAPLHEAAKGGDLDVTKRLIELGADTDAVDSVGQTILHVAALAGNVAVVQYVLQGRLIDVNAQALFGVTPLVAARRSQREEIVELLVKHGAR